MCVAVQPKMIQIVSTSVSHHPCWTPCVVVVVDLMLTTAHERCVALPRVVSGIILPRLFELVLPMKHVLANERLHLSVIWVDGTHEQCTVLRLIEGKLVATVIPAGARVPLRGRGNLMTAVASTWRFPPAHIRVFQQQLRNGRYGNFKKLTAARRNVHVRSQV